MVIFNRNRPDSVAGPVLTILLGFLLILNRYGIGKMLAVLIGILLLLSGAVDLYRYYRYGRSGTYQRGGLLVGIIKCILGLLSITRAGMVISLIGFIVGIFVIVNAVNSISNSLRLRSFQAPGWVISMVFSVLFLLAGIYILFNPLRIVASVFMFLGILVLLDGIFGLIQWYAMRGFYN